MGASVGPLVGGFLTTYYSWRLVFRFEVAIVMVVVIFQFLIKKDILSKVKQKFDYAGSLFIAAGMFCIVLGVLLATDYGWWVVKQPLVIGGAEIALFGLSVTPFLIGFGILVVMILFSREKRFENSGKPGLFKPSLLDVNGLLPGFLDRGL